MVKGTILICGGVLDKLDGGAVPVDVVDDEVGAGEFIIAGSDELSTPDVGVSVAGEVVFTVEPCKVGTGEKGAAEAFNEFGEDEIDGTVALKELGDSEDESV